MAYAISLFVPQMTHFDAWYPGFAIQNMFTVKFPSEALAPAQASREQGLPCNFETSCHVRTCHRTLRIHEL